MSQKRYYDDSYTTRFAAQVARTFALDGRPAVVLEETFFYPSSGGQPHDTGTLNETQVVEVLVHPDDGAVVHILDAPLAARAVQGVIDWGRRFDHMQHHSGQHILSQAFLRVATAQTVGFHLGADSVTIDLDRDDVAADVVTAAERLANEVVWSNRPVSARLVTHQEAAALDLRKIPAVDDNQLRLVDIAGFDLTACGGTHVAATGEVGLIKIIRTGRQRGKLRVEFRCGKRAQEDYGTKNEIIQQLSNRLTVGFWELDVAVDRLQETLKSTRRALKRAQNELVTAAAERLREQGTMHGPLTLVRQVLPPEDAHLLRQLAQQLTGGSSVVALLAVNGPPVQIVAARANDAPGDMGRLMADILADLRVAAGQTPSGGGGARFAQGGGVAIAPEALENTLNAAVERLLDSFAAS